MSGNSRNATDGEVLACWSGMVTRKLKLWPDGALYVAREAGRGGNRCQYSISKSTGRVFVVLAQRNSAIQNGVAERVVTGLPSLALPDGWIRSRQVSMTSSLMPCCLCNRSCL